MDPRKILIAIPFWHGDKAQALVLARLIADLQQEHSQIADICFVSRFDTAHDRPTIDYVARKFNVFAHVSQRREIGWPHGCNGTFFGTMEWFQSKAANYKALFIAESDGAPLVADWIQRLSLEWDKANEMKPVYVAGAYIPDKGGHDHINGGCNFISSDEKFLHWLVNKVGGITISAGWDWALSEEFKKWGWADITSIKSYWRRPTFTDAEWTPELNKGTVWLHGLKDNSLLELSRKKLLA